MHHGKASRGLQASLKLLSWHFRACGSHLLHAQAMGLATFKVDRVVTHPYWFVDTFFCYSLYCHLLGK
jgi:hypothetical protein